MTSGDIWLGQAITVKGTVPAQAQLADIGRVEQLFCEGGRGRELKRRRDLSIREK